MTTAVRHNESSSRFELVVDGELIGIADYRIRGDRIVMPHTEITPSRRGRGYGDVLVRGALDQIRPTGRTVVPTCWFVAQFIETHPEYGDLLAADDARRPAV
jgi:predicted GNAT family acetyltransferase